MIRSSAVRISDPSCVAEARRAAIEHARSLEWDEVARGEVALIATELATNLARHAGEGAVILNSANGSERTSLQIVAVDRGPGIADVARSFEDGYSSGGSPGTGLGAIRRIADTLEVYSTPAKGTVLVAELQGPAQPGARLREGFEIGGVCVQRAGETVSGDSWDVLGTNGAIVVLLVDGLGHGPLAADAARAALEAFRASTTGEPTDIIASLHEALRPTRGAAAALALIDPAGGALRYCGIGNICASIVESTGRRSLVSHNGTLGHSVGRITEFSYPWRPGASLVMHSDGVSARWDPGQWPGLWQRAPSLAAGVIYRDWRRETDDATVVVVRSA